MTESAVVKGQQKREAARSVGSRACSTARWRPTATGTGRRAWAGRETGVRGKSTLVLSQSTILTLSSTGTPEPLRRAPLPAPASLLAHGVLWRTQTTMVYTGNSRLAAMRARCSAGRARGVVRALLASHNGGGPWGPASACCHSRLCLFFSSSLPPHALSSGARTRCAALAVPSTVPRAPRGARSVQRVPHDPRASGSQTAVVGAP